MPKKIDKKYVRRLFDDSLLATISMGEEANGIPTLSRNIPSPKATGILSDLMIIIVNTIILLINSLSASYGLNRKVE
jgi:hypothetical protein